MLLRRWLILLLVVMAALALIVTVGPTWESDLAYWVTSIALILLPFVLIFVLRLRVFQPVKTGEIAVVERFHQLYDIAPPGLLPLLPFGETARIIPTAEQVKEYHVPAVLTNDGVSIGFDLVITYRVKRPTKRLSQREIAKRVLYDVADWHEAIKTKAISCLHETVGGMAIRTVLGAWTTTGDSIRAAMQPAADEWGVDIRSVALMNPKISPTLEAALEDRHAAAAEAEATGYRAGGEAQRLSTLSNGLAGSPVATEVLFERYIQALERLSDSQSTHIVLPIEIIRGLKDLIQRNAPGAGDAFQPTEPQAQAGATSAPGTRAPNQAPTMSVTAGINSAPAQRQPSAAPQAAPNVQAQPRPAQPPKASHGQPTTTTPASAAPPTPSPQQAVENRGVSDQTKPPAGASPPHQS